VAAAPIDSLANITIVLDLLPTLARFKHCDPSYQKMVDNMADRSVSIEEIKKHASEQDCWIVVDDVVWDITEFIPSHPGGNESE